MSAPEPTFTERQAKAWTEAVADIRSRGVNVDSDINGSFYWTPRWEDEVRPGRGHLLDAIWIDGEHFVQVRMDVYGYPSISIAALEWLHASEDEECGCDRCEAERREDDEEIDGRKVVDVVVVGGVL
ncbi:hypothetical protein GCM10027059_26850 [Myceligenerans halotolerans]